MVPTLPLSLIDAFAEIIRGVLRVVEAQRRPKLLTAPLIALLGARIAGIGKEFARLAEQIRAGTLPAPRPRRSAVSSRAGVSRAAAPPPARLFPTHLFGWLYRVVEVDRHHAAHQGLVLERLL